MFVYSNQVGNQQELKLVQPWLVWLSGLSASCEPKGSIPNQGTCLGCRPGPQ